MSLPDYEQHNHRKPHTRRQVWPEIGHEHRRDKDNFPAATPPLGDERRAHRRNRCGDISAWWGTQAMRMLLLTDVGEVGTQGSTYTSSGGGGGMSSKGGAGGISSKP